MSWTKPLASTPSRPKFDAAKTSGDPTRLKLAEDAITEFTFNAALADTLGMTINDQRQSAGLQPQSETEPN